MNLVIGLLVGVCGIGFGPAGVVDSDNDGVPDVVDVCCDTPVGLHVDLTGRPIGDVDGDCDVDLRDTARILRNMSGPLKPDGPCEAACETNAECDDGEFCARPFGECGGPGHCRTRPSACPDVYLPVCGCDEKTYGNACEAAANGVGVRHEGVCESDQRCESNAECPPVAFCAQHEGDCGGVGICRVRPQVCPLIWDPVCGCDGQTYGNACEAASHGINVGRRGICDCKGDENCRVGQICVRRVGDCDGVGECRERPPSCPEIYDPVCGCDGQTHANLCLAYDAGVSVKYPGPCDESIPCNANDDCPSEAFYCASQIGNCESPGMCRFRPAQCPAVYAPVCGCDGKDYANACEAAARGVRVAHEGVCPERMCVSNDQCPCGQVCVRTGGDCDGVGYCISAPTNCPTTLDPACGCDGRTYRNTCEALVLGVSIAHLGACSCHRNTECPSGEYCRKQPGACDDAGRCDSRPDVCPENFAPVCGCDRRTYPNACYAAHSGVNVFEQGECPVSKCELPPDPGPCDGVFVRYYFDAAAGECKQFVYGGCGGNANNFPTLAECRAACGGVDVCGLPMDPGPCRAVIPRYAYNANTGRCELFIYGGCLGNANNFETLEQCDAACQPSNPCDLPIVSGPCDAFIPRFAFNRHTGQCERFIYGGCGGNSNNFPSLDACETQCPTRNRCALPIEVGPCLAVIPRFAFNEETGQCEPFNYGGCGGNANNFDTLQECRSACGP